LGADGAATAECHGRGERFPGHWGLHKGELGIAVLAADLTRPEIASMPFFGSMR
jgi:hypothetical protein